MPVRKTVKFSAASVLPRLRKLRDRRELPLTLRGRDFSYRDLKLIASTVERHFSSGRTLISELVCEKLDWRQPNGWLKDRACRDVLRKLHDLRLIRLPPLLTPPRSESEQRSARGKQPLNLPDLTISVSKMPAVLDLELAKGNSAEELWNELIRRYHYLGHTILVGRCLKYLIHGDGCLIGAISFSSPSWKLAARDKLLRTLDIGLADVHERVVNNSRFLLLPNVRVDHLASRVLAHAARQVVIDWSRYYAVTPWFAETFVEPNRFEGTCYRAANWTNVGRTEGFAKVGRSHHNSQEPKLIFLYGLSRKARRQLQVALSAALGA